MRLSLESFDGRTAETPTSRDGHSLHLKAFVRAAALLTVMAMVTIIVGPILRPARAAHASDVAAALADTLQFKGPAIFLAP